MTCPNCNHNNPEGSKFCEECGTKLPEPKKKCPSCGFELNGMPKFCPECGFGLTDTPSVHRILGVSIGDKNVVAGDLNVVGKKEEFNVSGNATIIKQDDDTKKIETCPICGKSYFRIDGRLCKSCGRYVCSDCFDDQHHVCDDCRKRDVEEAESKYRHALEDVLSDGKIDKEESIRLNVLRDKLGISVIRAKELESDAKEKKTQDILSSIDEINLEKSISLFVNGRESDAFEIAKGLYSHHPGNDKVIRIYYLSGAVNRSNEVLEKAKAVEYDVPLKYISLFLYYFNTSDYPMADKTIQKALMLWPESIMVRCCDIILLREIIEKTFSEKLSNEIKTKIKDLPAESADAIEQCYINKATKTYVEEADKLLFSNIAEKSGDFSIDDFFIASLENNEGICAKLNEENEAQAFKLYNKSLIVGDPLATFRMAMCYAMGYGIHKDYSIALEYMRKASEEGMVYALVCIGICQEKGLGIESNIEKAIEKYKEAAKRNNAFAMYKIGKCLLNGVGIEKDEETALEYLIKAMSVGYKDAQFLVAECYMYGIGTEKNERQAFDLYLKIARNGELEAIRIIAKCYSEGIGTGKDEAQAFSWYFKIAEAGDIYAQKKVAYDLMNGIGTEKNEKQAVEWYQKVAESGDWEAELIVARCYKEGLGVKENIPKAFSWYLKLAEAGNDEAMGNVALCFLKGIGVEKDEREAFNWYYKAAKKGSLEAQYYVGICLSEGKGVEKNGEEAFSWFLKSAEQGFSKAQCHVADCFRRGINTVPSRKKALYWYFQAAKQGDSQGQYCMYLYSPRGKKWLHLAADNGNASAQYHLAVLFYENGDYTSAEKWMKTYFQTVLKAAEKGDSEAQLKTALCYKMGRGVEPDEEEFNKWISKAADSDKWLPDAHFVLLFHSWNFRETLYCYMRPGWKWSDWEIPEVSLKLDKGDFSSQFKDFLQEYQLKDKEQELFNAYRQALKDMQDKWANHYYDKLQSDAKQNNANAQYLLGNLLSFHVINQDSFSSFDWYTRAAENGSLEGAFSAGKYYYNHNEKNKGVEWLTIALSSNEYDDSSIIDNSDLFNLFTILDKADRADVDERIAFEYFKKGAEIKGSYYFISGLCDAYLYGIGTEKNRLEAIKCLYKSGDTYRLLKLLLAGNEKERKLAFRIAKKYYDNPIIEYYQRLSMLCILGKCYEFGLGVDRDLKKAFCFYKKSFEEDDGSLEASIALGRCYELGGGTEVDLVEATTAYTTFLERFHEPKKLNVSWRVRIAVVSYRLSWVYKKRISFVKDRKHKKEFEKQAVCWMEMAEEAGYDGVLGLQFEIHFRDVDRIVDDNPYISFDDVRKRLQLEMRSKT